MTQKFHILFLITALLSIVSCRQDKDGTGNKIKFSSAAYQHSLQERFNKEDSSYILKPVIIENFDTLKYFYSTRDYEPLYIKDFEDTSFIYSVLGIISKAGEHGLQPAMYNYYLIKDEYLKSLAGGEIGYKHLANTEILISDALIKYAYHMRYGAVNPQKAFYDSYFLPVIDSAKREILKPLYTENVLEYIKQLAPKNPQYKKLQTALTHFNELNKQGWDKIPSTEKKYKPGDKSPIFNKIIERLETLGYLNKGTGITDKFDSVLVNPVKNFQRANGLIDDGTIGKPTIEKLNTTPAEYIEKIKLSLERLRWSTYADTSRYILVNIPDFYLHLIENGQEKFNIRVCTGRKKPANFYDRMKVYMKTHNWRNRPDDWETPQICGQVTHLVLNPTWTVPSSIIKEEIYHEVMKDSTYLLRKNFKVYKNGKEVSVESVNMKNYSPNKIPFSFVQDPGAGNALGKIKFMFVNRFGIYLHDTPTRGPFSNSVRAVSHGCIRVEKPFVLAEYLLKGHSKWNIDYVKIETGFAAPDNTKIAEFRLKRNELRRGSSYGKTTEVKLEQNIPVFVDYFTAWVDEFGIVNFRPDVYGKDKILKNYLNVQD
jgi:murein L,D-transpeptidase YcbB/YkuD